MDYRSIAQQKYLKFLDDKLRQEKEELEKIEIERKEKEVFELAQLDIIQTSMFEIKSILLTYDFDTSDDNVILILITLMSNIEQIFSTKLSEEIKKPYIEEISSLVIDFVNSVNKISETRVKHPDMIPNVVTINQIFSQIFELLNLDVDIVIMDTDGDEQIAKEHDRIYNSKDDEKLAKELDVADTSGDEKLARELSKMYGSDGNMSDN
jgi:hypothetical protein